MQKFGDIFGSRSLTTLLTQAKENADDLLKQKIELEKEKRALVDSAAEKDTLLKTKIKTVGNIVHDSVPVSDNEVDTFPLPRRIGEDDCANCISRITMLSSVRGHRRV